MSPMFRRHQDVPLAVLSSGSFSGVSCGALDVASTHALESMPSSLALSAAPRGNVKRIIDMLPLLIIACLLTSALFNRLPEFGIVGIFLAALARRVMDIGLFLLGAVLTCQLVRNIGLRQILLTAVLLIAVNGPTLISYARCWV